MAIAPTLSDVSTGNESEFHIDVGAGLVQVAEVIDLPELPSGARDLYETTHMQSGPFKEYKKTPRKDGETVTITGNAVLGSTTETTCAAAQDADGAVPYKLVVKQDDLAVTFEGYCLVLSHKISNPMADRRTFEMSVKWVNAPTQTAV